MSAVRPLVESFYGRQNDPVRIPIAQLLYGAPKSYTTSDTTGDSDFLDVASTVGMEQLAATVTTCYALVGQPGNGNARIYTVDAVSSGVVSFTEDLEIPVSASTPVYLLTFDQIKVYYGDTTDFDDAQEIDNSPLAVDPTALTTNFSIAEDVSEGYFFATFYNSVDAVESVPSDPMYAPSSYTLLSARSIIDAAKGELNKDKNTAVLTDEYAFQQLDAFQTDVLKELKRWSFMQEFDAAFGQFNVGEWRLKLPDGATVVQEGTEVVLPAIDDDETNKSIYNIRVGANGRLTWIDKAKWDDFINDLAYSTLAVDLIDGATTMQLVDSSDFNHETADNDDAGGTVIIGGNSYTYTDNDIETGTLTLEEAVTADNTATAGQYVFQNANQGLPQYYTVFGGYAWYWPIAAAQYDGLNAYMDYYKKQTRILHDSDEIVVPDPLAGSNFLQWKFQKRLNNGKEDEGSISARNEYVKRRDTLKNKEVKNRIFKQKPRFQNFSVMMQANSGDPRFIRDGNFPNTGF
jgi:hypothetical protein